MAKEKHAIGNGYWKVDNNGGWLVGYRDEYGTLNNEEETKKNHCDLFKKSDGTFGGEHRGFCPQCRGDNMVSYAPYFS